MITPGFYLPHVQVSDQDKASGSLLAAAKKQNLARNNQHLAHKRHNKLN